MFEIVGAVWDLLKRASFRAYWPLRKLFRWLAARLPPRPGERGPEPSEEDFSQALERHSIQYVRIASEDIGLVDADIEIYLVCAQRLLVVVAAPHLVAKNAEEIVLSAWIARFHGARAQIAGRLGIPATDVGLVVVGLGRWLEGGTAAHVMILSRAGFFDMLPRGYAEIEEFGAAAGIVEPIA